MKKTAGIVGGILLSVSMLAQQTQDTTVPQQTPVAKTWEAKNNPTVDSITSKYKDKAVVSKPAPGIHEIFPAIGNYEPGVGDARMVTITLDEQNKGIAWIDGLPQGRIKALLRKSPSTYKIPAQKTVGEIDVAEGTMIFDKDENKLNIVIGKPFDDANPMSSFTEPEPEPAVEQKSKASKKVKPVPAWRYTGTKIVTETAIN